MVERCLSNNEEIKEKYQEVGVVVFVFNEEGEILVIKENTQNLVTRKNVGDYGVICETTKEGESWEETVMRGLEEELGLAHAELASIFEINPEHCFLGESLFVESVLARVVVVHLVEMELPLGDVNVSEISVIGWEKSENLLSYQLRAGVRNVLQKCLEMDLLQKESLVGKKDFLPLSVENLRIITQDILS
ncbi:NUDIX hydrolase [Candidatus Woesebacteria bacterium]|nr:NUDIX hydrolase [Candidatus Woesebacteria bacterium]